MNPPQRLASTQLEWLAATDTEAALSELTQQGQADSRMARQLADAALTHAETSPQQAHRWLDLARTIMHRADPQLDVSAQIHYAQARIHTVRSELTAAESELRRAQRFWQEAGDEIAYNRSFLGLTQILAMQGRYNEAEASIRQLIASTAQIDDEQPDLLRLASTARRNHANLLLYKEKHAAALSEYEKALQILSRLHAQASDDAEDLAGEIAHVLLNQATAHMSLNQTDAAETGLQNAASQFTHINDMLNRGRAHANLGALYLRTGRYAAALTAFEQAISDLLNEPFKNDGVDLDEMPVRQADELLERMRQADVLLDRANVFLVLNLQPEAFAALEHCESMFRRASQPYELGQSLYMLGMLYLRDAEFDQALVVLSETRQIFSELQNAFWCNRTDIALAVLAYQQGDQEGAASRLNELLPTSEQGSHNANDTIEWDAQTLAEARLLQAQIFLEQHQPDAARRVCMWMASEIGSSVTGSLSPYPPLPHLHLRLENMLGCVEALENPTVARQHFSTAIQLLETQRATLPLEEIRMAFLEDKTQVYENLVLSLLNDELNDDATSRDAGNASGNVQHAFNTVESARSRALLERLLTAQPEEAESQSQAARQIRQRIYWLYNRILSEGGSHQADPRQMLELHQEESALQQLEWRASPLLAHAQPVDLPALQAALTEDQQALVYYIAGTEVLCFLVDRTSIQAVRHICTAAELEAASAELQFQMGRIELGEAYFQRHAKRLQAAVMHALHQLYNCLVAPFASMLNASRLLIIPYGAMHLIPFHALWNGEKFLVEQYEFRYAPSVSVAVQCQQKRVGNRFATFAGLAISASDIPAARKEVQLASAYFDDSWLYLDDDAKRANLRVGAQQADVLHVATHGLFRPDNPFFSALKLADGWMDVREIYRLPLTARLVVLSACESGAGRIRGGDEVIGLARGFLSAGARSLMVSLWTVHDASAAEIMDRFYSHLLIDGRGETDHISPAAALRRAQLESIREQRHPYFWAPFIYVG